ncbi:sodium-coupled monocarboxylate transporter 1-like [Saccostrea echinata]|uniref:sodium-coupled monocarboxylate transporter 1-like n=1 Tax=Saccostrea echinata TaxID=191078 RepID=UPI002A807561|nr:sodium-coupled monocarboxylate transporter 1-like [Saccostrea echinata]
MSSFVIVDYVVFCLTISISLGIGVYYAIAGQKTTSEYLVGGRQMKILPVAISLMVSFESSIMMLGFPAETYVYGMMFWLSNFGFLTSCLLATRMVVPLVHPLKITSINEYFELRYNSRYVRLLNLTMGYINYILYMGIVLFGPGIALESVTNFPMWASTLVVAVCSVIYTSIGGIKAVIWTDVFQSLVMFMGIFAILIKGTMVAGGLSNVIEINKNTGRLDILNFDPDPTIRHTFWSLVIGGCLRMVSLNTGQTTVQRIVSTPTQKAANRVLYLAGPAFFITLTLATLEGAVAYAFFSSLGCDPLKSKKISNPNQVVPFMVLEIFKEAPGMAGLFMASLFSASLSTLSSGLSSLSALAIEDVVRPTFKSLSERSVTLIAKISVVVIGALCVGVSFLIAKIKGPMSQISFSVLAAFGGPASGLFLFSVFCPWGNAKGAIIGTLLTAVVGLWITTEQNFSTTLKRTPGLPPGPTDKCYDMTSLTNMTFMSTTMMQNTSWQEATTSLVKESIPQRPQGLDRFYSLSYQWLTGFLIIVSLIFCSLASIIIGRPDPATVDVRYVLPFFDQFFPFLPKKLRKKLYGGVPFEKREELIKKLEEEKKQENEFEVPEVLEKLNGGSKEHVENKSEESSPLTPIDELNKEQTEIPADEVVLLNISTNKNNIE